MTLFDQDITVEVHRAIIWQGYNGATCMELRENLDCRLGLDEVIQKLEHEGLISPHGYGLKRNGHIVYIANI